jgi:hypothetical protein
MLDVGEQVTSRSNRFSSTERTPVPKEEGPVWASKPIQALWGSGEYFVPAKSRIKSIKLYEKAEMQLLDQL